MEYKAIEYSDKYNWDSMNVMIGGGKLGIKPISFLEPKGNTIYISGQALIQFSVN